MLTQLARHIQARRAAQATGEEGGEVQEGEEGVRIVLPEDCHVQ